MKVVLSSFVLALLANVSVVNAFQVGGSPKALKPAADISSSPADSSKDGKNTALSIASTGEYLDTIEQRQMEREMDRKIENLDRMEDDIAFSRGRVPSQNRYGRGTVLGGNSWYSPKSYRDRYRRGTRGARRSNISGNNAYLGETTESVRRIWETREATTVQGRSLLTWSFSNPYIERVHVLMKTEGRPLEADVELWHGPDHTPVQMRAYVEDGAQCTFSAFFDTVKSPNTIAIRNTGMLEFPLEAIVTADDEGVGDEALEVCTQYRGETIQGGAMRSYNFDPKVGSAAILLETDGRPLNCKIEIMQGPNHNKQLLHFYSEDGVDQPFFAIIQTPGHGCVIRVINTGPMEFPITASVQPFEMASPESFGGAEIRRLDMLG